jgi:hypothetical protein
MQGKLPDLAHWHMGLRIPDCHAQLVRYHSSISGTLKEHALNNSGGR